MVNGSKLFGSQNRVEQVSKADKQRIEEIAVKVIEVLAENKVIIQEIPVITAAILAIVNKKLDNADIETVIKEL